MSLETLTETWHKDFQIYNINEITNLEQLEVFAEKLK